MTKYSYLFFTPLLRKPKIGSLYKIYGKHLHELRTIFFSFFLHMSKIMCTFAAAKV